MSKIIKIVTLSLIFILLVSTFTAYAVQQRSDYSATVFSDRSEKLMLYNANCAVCHGQGKRGQQASQIGSAINKNIGGMGSLKFLNNEQISAIATF